MRPQTIRHEWMTFSHSGNDHTQSAINRLLQHGLESGLLFGGVIEMHYMVAWFQESCAKRWELGKRVVHRWRRGRRGNGPGKAIRMPAELLPFDPSGLSW